MKPQTADLLRAAGEALSDARVILAANVPRQAARLAYYAQFHAAQAFIFERSGKVSKTHRGVSAQFHKLAKSEPAIDPGLAPELTGAYHYKEVADYDAGGLNTITAADAQDAVSTAEHFVRVIRQVLLSPHAASDL